MRERHARMLQDRYGNQIQAVPDPVPAPEPKPKQDLRRLIELEADREAAGVNARARNAYAIAGEAMSHARQLHQTVTHMAGDDPDLETIGRQFEATIANSIQGMLRDYIEKPGRRP